MLREKAVNLTTNSPWHCQKLYTEYRYFGVKDVASLNANQIKNRARFPDSLYEPLL